MHFGVSISNSDFQRLQHGQVFRAEFQSGDGTEIGFDGVQNIELRAEIGGVVGRANERTGSAVAEAFIECDLLVFRKLIRMDVFDHRKMFRCRAEVLAEGEDGDIVL